MLIEIVSHDFKIIYKHFESGITKADNGRSRQCALCTYFSLRIKPYNLQTKPIFAFAFIFLGCTH